MCDWKLRETQAASCGQAGFEVAAAGGSPPVRRLLVRTNGGASGPGDARVAALAERSFADVTRAPDEGFAADVEDSEEDADMVPDNVFNSGPEDWYNYNGNGTRVTGRRRMRSSTATPRRGRGGDGLARKHRSSAIGGKIEAHE